MKDHFIWADLSTFDLDEAQRFYQKVFGWQYQPLDEDYQQCMAGRKQASGLYTMPEKFQTIGLPSFWMSYINVENIEETVHRARQHNAIVEISPQNAPGSGQIALIRDPAGAGFTCYQGDGFNQGFNTGEDSTVIWNELHISDLSKVETFYKTVFDWKITPGKEQDRYLIQDSNSNETIAGIRITSNDIKGDKEYWGVYFRVSSLANAVRAIESAGGEVVARQAINDIESILAYDSQGAAFYVVEDPVSNNPVSGARSNQRSEEHHTTVKWRALTGLLIVALAVLLEANWIWGLLFLLWALPDIKSGSTHFLEQVDRSKNPVVYWLIVVTWIGLSLYLLLL